MARIRKDAGTGVGRVVRMSIPVSAEVHAKLCWLAADRGVDRSELASGFIAGGVRNIVVQERGRDDGSGSEGGS